MTHTDPSADAFMRRILANPGDALPRLVFADWLEETDKSSNIAWARYLRLADELANSATDDARRPKMAAELERVGALVQARLTYRAEVFVAYPEAMQQLLPARNMVLSLDTLMLPLRHLELLPASLALEHAVLPLAEWDGTLALAMNNVDRNLCELLGWIMNRNILPISAPIQQLRVAVDRHYGLAEGFERVDSGMRPNIDVTIVQQPSLFVRSENGSSPVIHLLDQFLGLAIQFRVSALEMEIRSGEHSSWVQVWHHFQGGRRAVDTFPAWLLPEVAARLRTMADIASILHPVQTGVIPLLHRGLTYQLPVQIADTENGPHVYITIPTSPTDPPVLAVNPAA